MSYAGCSFVKKRGHLGSIFYLGETHSNTVRAGPTGGKLREGIVSLGRPFELASSGNDEEETRVDDPADQADGDGSPGLAVIERLSHGKDEAGKHPQRCEQEDGIETSTTF